MGSQNETCQAAGHHPERPKLMEFTVKQCDDGNRAKVVESEKKRWSQIAFDALRLRQGMDEVDLPDYKFIVHFHKAKSGLPIRGGLARLAAWAYMFKNYTVKDWAIFCEAYGHPLRLGKYEATAKPEDSARPRW